jgi:hypothetical protein
MLNYADAINFAKNEAGKVTLDLNRVFNELPELIDRLSIGIPPNEVGDPGSPTVVDYRSSLLAAWMVKIRRVSSDGSDFLTSDQTVSLYKKTLSAIEYVILQEQYQSHIVASDNKNGSI